MCVNNSKDTGINLTTGSVEDPIKPERPISSQAYGIISSTVRNILNKNLHSYQIQLTHKLIPVFHLLMKLIWH